MQQYKELLQRIMTTGNTRGDRTGTGTRSVFGHQMRFNLQDGFPLVTLKRTPFHLIIAELFWFLEGSTDNNRLRELSGVEPGKRGIWDDWSPTPDDVYKQRGGNGLCDMSMVGQLGPVYGQQYRNWNTYHHTEAPGQDTYSVRSVDQIRQLIAGLKDNPYSRRHIVSAWNVQDLPDETMSPQRNVMAHRMALAPCHVMYQCYVRDLEDGRRALDLQVYQRSTDCPVGLPFNIASYALLTHLLASACGYVPGELVWTGGDNHVYSNQFDEVGIMLERDVRPLPSFQLPDGFDLSVILNGHATRQDVLVLAEQLHGYDPHPAIKIAVAV